MGTNEVTGENFTLTKKEIHFHGKNLNGKTVRNCPLTNISSMEYGYNANFFLKLFLFFFLGVALISLLITLFSHSAEAGVVLFFFSIFAAGISWVLYEFYSKYFFLSFETIGGKIFLIAFKRGIIETILQKISPEKINLPTVQLQECEKIMDIIHAKAYSENSKKHSASEK